MNCQHRIKDDHGAILDCIAEATNRLSRPGNEPGLPQPQTRSDYYCSAHLHLYLGKTKDERVEALT